MTIGPFGYCQATLITLVTKGKPKPGEPCHAMAAFTSRGNPCCWVHYQADTAGPRAGKVEFKK